MSGSKSTVEEIAKANADARTKSGKAAEKIIEGNADALTESGKASGEPLKERAPCQSALTRNADARSGPGRVASCVLSLARPTSSCQRTEPVPNRNESA